MTEILALSASVAGVVLIPGGLIWLARRVRQRGRGGEVMGPFEEIWHPAAHTARLRLEVQEERMAPTPSPGDPLRRAGGRGAGRRW